MTTFKLEGSDPLLTREKLSCALTEAGYPISRSTLASKATRGGGPPFRKFGRRVLYPWLPALKWAESRLGPLVSSTAEFGRGSLKGIN